MKIIAGARSSPLSRKQFFEMQNLLPSIDLIPFWASSPGDRDKKTSLRTLGQTNFFTKDLDELLLNGTIRIAIHSAKDLPDPIPLGLTVVAITQGIDPRDSLVFKGNECKKGGVIAVSSARREEALRRIDPTFCFTDLRGTIEERLKSLEKGDIDGVVIAEAALIRLELTHLPRIILTGPTHPLQGKLAVLARQNDEEMKTLISFLHYASDCEYV